MHASSAALGGGGGGGGGGVGVGNDWSAGNDGWGGYGGGGPQCRGKRKGEKGGTGAKGSALLLLLPAGFAEANPAAHAALLRNQHRRVTAYDLHATLKHLAEWPTMPQPTEEATSLFVDLPDERDCAAARVPMEWCLDTPPECTEGMPLGAGG